ncbi:class I fructose-bisphosphate aldolase [Marinobacter sp. CHS3-4]|uniref:class I fructose-bisphosphate aldolase n=1 Tax=Marinobacter sp. CHS3-4 TaxID=3045174 RepID=UPI0024B498BD|nr:class I fructose-bisphosphate aldolase [Marinobacter sp. CHS3-4]MDI9246926.1 fructose-bisphosphate aldolase class I [Marinobacter sp. CHS3-4]
MSIQAELQATIQKMVQPGKGVLAADESHPTIAKRFKAVGVESTEALRQEYRSIIFSAPGLSEHISGVILFSETLEQDSLEGIPMPELLSRQGIVPGIKVDQGKGPLAHAPDEEVTFGLDGLEQRLADAKKLGARFAKWRCVFHISDTLPSELAVDANAETLARYAAICQSLGIVPIVEPEVLIDGAHTIERSAEVNEQVIRGVFEKLVLHRVALEHMILKPSMVTPGKESPNASPEQVAEATIRTFRRCVPAAVPGIFFLSGGQTPEEATRNLNAMNQHANLPWTLTFSYGRALQEPAQHAWKGDIANKEAAHAAMSKRSSLNGKAALGSYTPEMENEA